MKLSQLSDGAIHQRNSGFHQSASGTRGTHISVNNLNIPMLHVHALSQQLKNVQEGEGLHELLFITFMTVLSHALIFKKMVGNRNLDLQNLTNFVSRTQN